MNTRFPVQARRGIIIALVLALAGWTSLAPANESAVPAREARTWPIQEKLDVSYAADAGDAHKLDIFSPRGLTDCPVVLFVHGGAWMVGDKDFYGYYRGVCEYLAQHGAVAVSINYRLSPRFKHPAQIDDVARAFAWVRRHIDSYGGNPDQIILFGHSAGGHLVSLLETDPGYLDNPALKLTNRDWAAIRGVISACGVYVIPGAEDLSKMAGKMIQGYLAENGNLSMPALLMGGVERAVSTFNPYRLVFGGSSKVCRDASPLSHVRRGLAPFLLFNANDDLPTLPEMTQEFAKALRKAGDKVEVRRFAGYDHNDILFHMEQPKDPVARLVMSFIDTHTTPGKVARNTESGSPMTKAE